MSNLSQMILVVQLSQEREVSRQTIREVGSGRIDIKWDGAFTRIEFNSDCVAALDVCKAMCCRRRVGFSIELDLDEVEKFQHMPHPANPEIKILQASPDGRHCIYLDDRASMCTVYDHRPRMCQQWHCSPEGSITDETIVRRDAGWVLMPMRKEEADFLESRLGGM